jgi:hypothetical protein
MDTKTSLLNIISWAFGVIAISIGLVNTFWGNDPGFGIFIILLSLVFVPPFTAFLKKTTGFFLHRIVKIGIGIFILWAALGVGELFDKIDLMITDLSN